ncbi:cytidine/deoxycytidylate deaminase family protein [Candidatus Woesearchaeota archaeon]|nr:cytidine/deoxycytidylate deaminase family protein [Candidatus Woesearchaeota archaeon]
MGQTDTMTEYKRPSWDEYFLNIANEVAKRATCDRGRSGCVIVKNKHILTTGYVGSPRGIAHCDEVGHLFKSVTHDDGKTTQHCMRTTHAEQNAICQAAKLGVPLEGATLYSKMEPCAVCAKMIINAGIQRVVCEKRYHTAQESRELFNQAGVQLDVIHDEVEKYEKQ